MIGEEVRRRREELGLTGAQLADRAGLAPSAVSQIETGKRSPSSMSVMKLADALGVEIGELYPKKAQASLPLENGERGLEPAAARAQPRAGSSAESHLAIRRTWEDLEQNLTVEQVREILEGVRDGRITVDAAARQLETLSKAANA
jgi:transcriptional regulator with XRE-family HTH domain